MEQIRVALNKSVEEVLSMTPRAVIQEMFDYTTEDGLLLIPEPQDLEFQYDSYFLLRMTWTQEDCERIIRECEELLDALTQICTRKDLFDMEANRVVGNPDARLLKIWDSFVKYEDPDWLWERILECRRLAEKIEQGEALTEEEYDFYESYRFFDTGEEEPHRRTDEERVGEGIAAGLLLGTVRRLCRLYVLNANQDEISSKMNKIAQVFAIHSAAAAMQYFEDCDQLNRYFSIIVCIPS